MLKLIYLARRKPGFTFDEFVCRWRKHGALGMAQPLWRYALAYVQAEPIDPAPLAGTSIDYDAIAYFTVHDDMFSGMTDDDVPGAMAMAEDELETFSAPIPTTSLWVREETIRAGEPGGITAFLFCASQTAARDIAERAAGAASLNRIVLNLPDDVTLGPEANTLPYAAVVELSAADTPALRQAIEENQLLEGADVTVVTRESVFWYRLNRAK